MAFKAISKNKIIPKSSEFTVCYKGTAMNLPYDLAGISDVGAGVILITFSADISLGPIVTTTGRCWLVTVVAVGFVFGALSGGTAYAWSEKAAESTDKSASCKHKQKIHTCT